MANKKITDATQISTMSGSDKLFVNSGDDLKQITLDQAVAASTPVQQLNSNLINTNSEVNKLSQWKASDYLVNVDLNNLTQNGVYLLGCNIRNCFAPDLWSPMIVIGNGTDTIRQIVFSTTGIYVRSKQINQWNSWVDAIVFG